MTKIVIGRKYKDLLTGYEGVAIGFCHYITGCATALIQPRGAPDKRPEPEWIDEQRLEQVGDEVVELPEADDLGRLLPNVGTGSMLPPDEDPPSVRAVGGDREAPKR